MTIGYTQATLYKLALTYGHSILIKIIGNNTMRFINIFLSLALASSFFFSAQAEEIKEPQQVIQTATDGVINALSKLSAEERTDEVIRDLVSNWIIPAVDETRLAMGALGKHWRTASAEQRQAFIDRYRELQIKTYSGAFKAFDGEKIVISDTIYNDKGDRAIVKSNLRQNNGNLIPVDFRLYQRTEDSPWLVYDAVVSGLSIVKTYRDQLNDRLQQVSMDQLLAELSEKTQD